MGYQVYLIYLITYAYQALIFRLDLRLLYCNLRLCQVAGVQYRLVSHCIVRVHCNS